MANNQIEFNSNYSKDTKEIKLRYKKFVGELVIENYSELENLQLLKINKVGKLTLSNLPQLSEVTIQSCGLTELIIENCPQIKTLNIKSNSLTNLNFLVSLVNLEQLDVEDNPQLIAILKPYKNDWKAYQQDLQEIKQGNFQKFWELKQSREELKKTIATLLKDKEKFTTSQVINTKELVFNLNQEFQEKEENINYLTSRAKELADSSKKQKEKIISSFLRLLSEKELAQQLVTLQLEFVKFKKQAIEQLDYSKKKRDYEKQLNELKDQLWDKLNEEEMNNLEMILTDCEELAQQEFELENRLNDKSALIASQEKSTFSEKEREIIAQNNEIQQTQLQELADLKAMLKELKSSNQSPMSKFLNDLKEKDNLTTEELTIIDKIKELLEKKNDFLTARQETIAELRSICDKLEDALIKGKYAQTEEGTKAFTIAGKAAGAWTFNLIEAFGEAAQLANAHYKRLFTIQKGQQFQLTLQDEPEIQTMERAYQELLTLLQEEMPLFSNDYKLYDVITNIWAGKAHIDTGDMKDAISLLANNLNFLKKEVHEQVKELQKLDSSFKLENLVKDSANNNTQEKKLQNDIQQQQKQLDELVTSFKAKLISKNFLNKEQKTQERKESLQQLLTIQAKIIRLQFSLVSGNIFVLRNELRIIKERLSKKLTITDFNNLYQAQTKLIQAQLNLARLQTQQQTQTQALVVSNS